jgi:hypothetical protein
MGRQQSAGTDSCGSPIKGVDKVEENLDNGDQTGFGGPEDGTSHTGKLSSRKCVNVHIREYNAARLKVVRPRGKFK